MPKPNPGESKKDYLSRCISFMIKQENREPKQAAAICYSYWNKLKNKTENISLENTLEFLSESLKDDISKTVSSTVIGGVPGFISNAKDLITSKITSIIPNSLNDKLTTDIIKPYKDAEKNVYNRKYPDPAYLASTDTKSNSNKIKTRPRGIVIQDTYNNLIFPIFEIKIDTAKVNLPTIFYHYKNTYTHLGIDYLPWHYVIEFIENKYYVFQTRPLDMKYPINTKYAKELISDNGLNLNKNTETYLNSNVFDLEDAIHVAIIGDSNFDVYTESIYELIGRTCSGPILRYFHLPMRINQNVIDFNLGKNFYFNKLDNYLRT